MHWWSQQVSSGNSTSAEIDGAKHAMIMNKIKVESEIGLRFFAVSMLLMSDWDGIEIRPFLNAETRRSAA
jgi:hypothetical protein